MKRIFALAIFLFISTVVFADAEDVIMITEMVSKNPPIVENKFYRGNELIARQRRDMGSVSAMKGIVEEEGKIPDGIVKVFYPSGELKSESHYINNRLDGVSKDYYKSGVIHMEKVWKNGAMLSTKLYNENGVLTQEAIYRNGNPKSMKIYDEKGNVVQQAEF